MLEVALACALGLLPFVPAGVLAPAVCAAAWPPAVRTVVSEPALGPDRVLTAAGGFEGALKEFELDAAPALSLGWEADEPEF